MSSFKFVGSFVLEMTQFKCYMSFILLIFRRSVRYTVTRGMGPTQGE
jgi:hypothetical protein